MQPSIVLVNPPMSLADRYGKDLKQFGAVSEPLGIAYIAGYLESLNIPVRIIDAAAMNMDNEAVVHDIRQHDDAIVGITMLTPAFAVVADLCRIIKRTLPDCLVVLGGAHTSALPQRTLEEIPEADIACIGEGEITMAEIAQFLGGRGTTLSAIRGICFRGPEGMHKNENRPALRALDQLPPPARHLLPMEKYHLTASRVAGDSYCPTIIVARGCPFACTYCSRTFGRTFRAHSIERILNEIEGLIDAYNISQVNIEADTLTVKRQFICDLCSGLIRRKLNQRIRWTCESRVDTVDEKILGLMKRAGCWQISYGVETGSQRLLDSINKSVTLKKIETIFALTKRLGISIRGFFMLGLPTETRAESLATIAFARKIDPFWAQFTITVPYPGTKMFADLDASGQIRTYDWSKYNTWSGWKNQDNLPYIAKGRSLPELIQLQKQALRQFYLRPRVILRFLKSIQSLYDLKKYTLGFLILVKSKLARSA
jgi:radical SAM superfamily enzyme YgiQ (UPF0313 family)